LSNFRAGGPNNRAGMRRAARKRKASRASPAFSLPVSCLHAGACRAPRHPVGAGAMGDGEDEVRGNRPRRRSGSRRARRIRGAEPQCSGCSARPAPATRRSRGRPGLSAGAFGRSARCTRTYSTAAPGTLPARSPHGVPPPLGRAPGRRRAGGRSPWWDPGRAALRAALHVPPPSSPTILLAAPVSSLGMTVILVLERRRGTRTHGRALRGPFQSAPAATSRCACSVVTRLVSRRVAGWRFRRASGTDQFTKYSPSFSTT
jgi:hypothetical protein